MKKNTTTYVRACNIISAILLVVLAVYQFLPFWRDGNSTSSIQGIVWLPLHHEDITDYLTKTVDPNFFLNDVILMPIVVLACAVIGLLMCTIKSDSKWSALIPAICAVVGIFGYLTTPIFQMGAFWGMHLAVCIEMLLVAAATFFVAREVKKQ